MLSCSCQKRTADNLAIVALACPKEEQSMRQNGSLCSVIAGNLAEVTLATQTRFSHWERGETVAVTTRPRQRSHPRATALSFVFSSAILTPSTGVIIVMQPACSSHGNPLTALPENGFILNVYPNNISKSQYFYSFWRDCCLLLGFYAAMLPQRKAAWVWLKKLCYQTGSLAQKHLCSDEGTRGAPASSSAQHSLLKADMHA